MELQYSTRDLARAAVIAAAYAALAWISNFFGLAFPAIQFRLSEALCVLPCRDRKAAIPGLAVGCLITNLLSPYGPVDVIFGTLATAIAAWLTMKMPKWYLAALPPILVNLVILTPMWAWAEAGAFNQVFLISLGWNAATFVLTESVVLSLIHI